MKSVELTVAPYQWEKQLDLGSVPVLLIGAEVLPGKISIRCGA
jgi:hypothetical protein